MLLRNLSQNQSGRRKKARGKQNAKKSRVSSAKTKTSKRTKKREEKSHKSDAAKLFSLFNLGATDVFRDSAMAVEGPDQPLFTERLKDKALKELVASVPEEHRGLAKLEADQLLEATKDFIGHGACFSDQNGGWTVRGMVTSLKHYQVLGAAFMRRRENTVEEPKGGLIADDMGLGKTVMMVRIACVEASSQKLTTSSLRTSLTAYQ
jgi:SNF2 family DNA or RNA helicase